MTSTTTPMQPISASRQFRAIAYLRWRLFANGFRRKGGKGELAARIIAYPIAFLMLFGAVSGAGGAAYAAASTGHLQTIALVFWAIFALQLLVSINVSPPGLSFDPAALIRFPLNFPRYLLVRIFLGLLAASTVVSTCALLAAATGIAVARPELALVAFAAALALALANMLFTRMIFAWVDRWLSTRRAREFFTAAIIIGSIGIQYLNVTFNGIGRHQSHADQAAKITAVAHFYNSISPALHLLPPGLAGGAIVSFSRGLTASAFLQVFGVVLYAAAFLAVFGWRMQREYRGENLSEANHTPQADAPLRKPAVPVTMPLTATNSAPIPATWTETAPATTSASVARPAPSPFNAGFSALLHKEWTYVRRNPAQFYGLLAPLAMVFIFAARMHNAAGFIFPAAAAYSILGVSALAYNVLGIDANGIQFYFLSPVSFRIILLAKNVFSFAITALQLILLYLLLTFTAGAPGVLMTLSVLCWVAFATLVNVTVGNIRSITTPKKVDPARISRRQTSQLSALLALALTLGAIGLGAAILFAGHVLRMPWLPIPLFLMLAGGAFAVYWAGLGRVDSLAATHREGLIEELAKTE